MGAPLQGFYGSICAEIDVAPETEIGRAADTGQSDADRSDLQARGAENA
jgi:hypothetical protein